MSISAALLPEFDHEMATTRRTLERVPEENFAWKPHEKSMTLGRLASHIAEMPSWGVTGLTTDSLDMGNYKPWQGASREEILGVFDKNVAAARTAIAGADDAKYMSNWSLTAGGKTMMTMPKVAVVRSFVLNHIIHHRGQLSVYLRLNNVAVPSIYGPSADEGQMGASA
ncbi:MAG TPA: DinB family protein [Bryobacteraceae bacterium]|nr:DinB family protein [Bryobacteraceae bacterium]